MIVNNPILYPYFKQGQQLKSTGLNGIVDFARNEEQDTRVFLEGAGIFYGLNFTVKTDEQNGTLTLSRGTAVTSDGILFSTEKDIVFNGVSKNKSGGDLTIELFGKDITTPVLNSKEENKDALTALLKGNTPYVVVLVVHNEESEDASCLYGYQSNGIKITENVVLALVDPQIFEGHRGWADTVNATSPGNDPEVERFGYTGADATAEISFTRFTSWEEMRKGFGNVCERAEQKIGDAYIALYKSVKFYLDPNDDSTTPFDGLAVALRQLRVQIDTPGTGNRRLSWLYDYYRDLIAAYRELAEMSDFNFHSYWPDKDFFRGYIALGGINITSGKNYRMGLYRPPFADRGGNALETASLLLQRMKYLAQVNNTIFLDAPPTGNNIAIRFIPDAGIHQPLSKRAVPFYYKDPQALAALWNPALLRTHRTTSIPGANAVNDTRFMLTDINGYTFFMVTGHINGAVKEVQDKVKELRKKMHLPFDVKIVYLDGDNALTNLFKECSAGFGDLGIVLEKIVNDIRCAGTCGEEFEISIFNEKFDRRSIGKMFEALVTFFGNTTDETLDEFVKDKCAPPSNESDKALPSICNSDDRTCCISALTSLYAVCKSYKDRKDSLEQELLFHRFAENHPGLEHNAGVPRGGTLVLVCARKDVTDLPTDTIAGMMKIMLRKDSVGLALTEDLATELSQYSVVADFCLPYVCCSKTPSVKVEFQKLPPAALFSVAGLVFNSETASYKLTLKNESLRASTYHWQLLDGKRNQLADKDTNDLNVPVDFELKLSNGVEYTVVLTASNEGLSSKYEQDLLVCPQNNVSLTSNGQQAIEIALPDASKPIMLEPSPYGGDFDLTVDGSKKQAPAFKVSWTEDRSSALLTLVKPVTGNYLLTYTFAGKVEGCTNAEATLKIAILDSLEKVFGRRAAAYATQIGKIKAPDNDDKLKEAVKNANDLMKIQGDVAALLPAYKKLLGSLPIPPDDTQKPLVMSLTIYATAYFIDRLVATPQDQVPAGSNDLVNDAVKVILPTGKDDWNKIWNPDEIRRSSTEVIVKKYEDMFNA
ncbi:MAG TPA: hypothetical protein VM802_07810 [Chitinophaga sp.]|uniref:hypothetical protein n=1 Tax=Chitinophaga sp. TaxID=1869181 RepID=UPI002C5A7660|nr:hypothetical protein [Chitinophaga sp.]HVI44759.1 hypothetical protein [Chitinophaga sp.]